MTVIGLVIIITLFLSLSTTIVVADANCDCSCKVECKNVYKNPKGGDFSLVDITRKIHLWPNVNVAAGGDTEYPDDRTCTQQISDEEVKDNGFLDPSEQCPVPANGQPVWNGPINGYSDFGGGGAFWEFKDKTGIDMKLDVIMNQNKGGVTVKLTLDTAAQRCEEDYIKYKTDTDGYWSQTNFCKCACVTYQNNKDKGDGYNDFSDCKDGINCDGDSD